MAAPLITLGGATAFKILRSLYKGGKWAKGKTKIGMSKIGMSTTSRPALAAKKTGKHLRKHHKVYSAGVSGAAIWDILDKD